jgi:hypothetical protein
VTEFTDDELGALLQAYRVSMGYDIWQSIDAKDQTIWDTVSDEAKTKILAYVDERAAKPKSKPAPAAKTRRSVHMAEVDDETSDNAPVNEQEEEEDPLMQANRAKQQAPGKPSKTKSPESILKNAIDEAHPGDARRVMAKANRKISGNMVNFSIPGLPAYADEAAMLAAVDDYEWGSDDDTDDDDDKPSVFR